MRKAERQELAHHKSVLPICLAIIAILGIDLALIIFLQVDGIVSSFAIAAVSGLAGHPIWQYVKQRAGTGNVPPKG